VKLRILLATAILAVAVPTIGAVAVDPTCPTVKAPDLTFGAPSYIDTTRAGGEPVSQVAQDGSIIVSAHAGTTHIYKNPTALPGERDFAVGYGNQTLHWRSADGGTTWKYIGLLGATVDATGGGFGPHTLQSTGFSDPDLTMDSSGRIYDVEIDLANDGVFSSVDDGQSWPHGHPLAAPGDRPWLTGQDPNEIYLYVNTLSLPGDKSFSRSTNGGLNWTKLPVPPVTSKSLVDPLNPHDGLIGPVGLEHFAISSNNGQSWEQFDLGKLGKSTQFFGAIGVDKAGNVYQAAAGGYKKPTGSAVAPIYDTTPDGEVTFTYYERATERIPEEKIVIPTPPGDALWPWIIAGDDGRAAVVWYQTLAGKPDDFYIYAAVTHNAHGTTVLCSDGSEQIIPPQFTVVNASQRVISHGKICLDGTACNYNPNFEGGDRRLGDFFTVNFDKNGDLFIVSGDTMLTNPVGGPKPVGNPIFIKQTTGDRMIQTPMVTRPTRPLCNNPATCT
jgi:hypothetical protein